MHAVLAFVLGVLFLTRPARAWIYPEHRDIGVKAWERLSPAARAFYAALWQRARFGYAGGLCSTPVSGTAPDPGATPEESPCLDFAAWPALAGDHSCSPDELVDDTLTSVWSHAVARVSERVRLDLADARSQSNRENIWITSNLLLEDVDAAYLTRAGANNAHFLLPFADQTLESYVGASSHAGAPLNAVGLYVGYHAAALRLARAIGREPEKTAGVLARRALALEAYALHFLQDMFSSGHVAGTWGNAATRKGTHDYYSTHGYSTTTWSGRNVVLYGDAHIRAADLARSAQAVAQSLEQLAAAALATPEPEAWNSAALAVGGLDSCKLLVQPRSLELDATTARALDAVLRDTPVPGRGEDSAAWPRYRSDFGPFLGFESELAAGMAFDGYAPGARTTADLGMALRLGYGLEDLLASVNSGTMYLSVGVGRQSEQVDYCTKDCRPTLGSSTLPRVPSRAAITIGLRMPFWVVPGDLLLLAPVLALASPSDLTRVAMRAASGGLIPWQRTFATGIGYVELVAGRVVTCSLFGIGERTHTFAWVDAEESALASIGFRSVMLTLPAVEYTPLRQTAQMLTASLQLRLAYAIDIPYDVVNFDKSSTFKPDWGPSHFVLLQLSFNGRSYY
jgi:hypothetical protein